MPARPTKQLHQCSLCGRKGHNVLRCEAPGAARYRKLLAIYKDDQRLNSKQTGRKGKTRPRRQKFGDRKKKATGTIKAADGTCLGTTEKKRTVRDLQ